MQITSSQNGIYRVTVPIIKVNTIKENKRYDLNNDIVLFTIAEKKQLGIGLNLIEKMVEKYRTGKKIAALIIDAFK